MNSAHKSKDARYLAAQVLERVPGVEVKVTAPSGRGSVWWVDASLKDHSVVVEWSVRDGFGLSATDANEFDTAASETFSDADEVVRRVVEVLTSRKKVPSRREMHLQRLREHREISQEALAELLHVSQATVSKTERREDILVSTLKSFVEALGGRLQLIAKFPSETIELSLPAGSKNP